MPLPAAEAPQWLTNLGILAGGAVTSIAGWIVMQRERKKPEPIEAGRIVALSGVLGDARAVEKLTDMIERNVTANRNLEDTIGDNTREIKRTNEALASVRVSLEARNRMAADEEARLLAAIDKTRGGLNP